MRDAMLLLAMLAHIDHSAWREVLGLYCNLMTHGVENAEELTEADAPYQTHFVFTLEEASTWDTE